MSTFSYERPPIWRMIKEAVENLGGKASHRDIISCVQTKYGPINEGTIRCQITICTVNSPSRVHYPENEKPRGCDSRYDFLYSTNRGEVTIYRPSEHGEWEIAEVNGKLAVVQKVGSSRLPLTTRKQRTERVPIQTEDTVYCPACKRDVIVEDERSVRCPFCNSKLSELFEKELREFLLKEWKILLRPRTVQIREMEKIFDLVSDNMNFIGDAKFYKSLDVPAAKWSTIAEYVWLLQLTTAKNKFLVFGRDRSVPQRWLNRHYSLIGDIKFYFFDHKSKKLETFI